jgi:hypothetical protein
VFADGADEPEHGCFCQVKIGATIPVAMQFAADTHLPRFSTVAFKPVNSNDFGSKSTSVKRASGI